MNGINSGARAVFCQALRFLRDSTLLCFIESVETHRFNLIDELEKPIVGG